MMKNVARLLLLGIVFLGFVPTAGAQRYDDIIQYQEPIGDDEASGSFYYCAAKGRWGGYCVDCVLTKDGKQCAGVSYSKACTCNDATCKNSGHCTYEP
jgi:hypothetical protein